MIAAHPTRLLSLVSVLALALAGTVHAQGTGRSMDIDVSVRSAAMGGASNALFRGTDLNHWGNPALLGYERGIRYERGRTQLVPGLADDVIYTSNFTHVGGYGVGLVFGGTPAGPDGVFLSYGASEGTDPGGNPTGTFLAHEGIESWGVGVSVVELIDRLRLRNGTANGWSRWADLSLGMASKEPEIALGPGFAGEADGKSRDLGLLVRVTPFDRLESGSSIPLRVDFSYGWSELNSNDVTVTFVNEDISSPLTRHRRNGFCTTIAVGFPGLEVDRIESPAVQSIVRGFLPFVSVSLTTDRAKLGAGDAIDYKTSGNGIEVSFANVFAYRHGHYVDRIGDIDGDTHGWSIGFPFGTFGGWMHEQAWFPQARDSGLEEVHRKAYSVWIDPFEIVAALRGRRSI